ncbi:MAG: alcohol dehydrogenase [Hyphomicrobiales bacterium]|nr:MAG: alcohol dehydrogenase [Hyphomicrobiales bacterium]
MTTMRAARLHTPGAALQIDDVPRPVPAPGDVLVEVHACGVVPNMNAVFSGKYWHQLPPFPAAVGLDAAGVVVECGSGVTEFRPGDRVYVNPWLSCGACYYCRTESPLSCTSAAFAGYFGFFETSRELLLRYPYGGLSEFVTAATHRLVRLPDAVSFDHAARMGYIGTSYSALKAGGVGPGSRVGLLGVTGTLGVAATLLALGMGASKILGIGRNREVLEQVANLSAERVETTTLDSGPLDEWLRDRTGGLGVDVAIDCSGRGTEPEVNEALVRGLKRGGRCVYIGAQTSPIAIEPTRFVMDRLSFCGSMWFSDAEAHDLIAMAAAGSLDLSTITTHAFPLEKVNDALEAVASKLGGFTNVVVHPRRRERALD